MWEDQEGKGLLGSATEGFGLGKREMDELREGQSAARRKSITSEGE